MTIQTSYSLEASTTRGGEIDNEKYEPLKLTTVKTETSLLDFCSVAWDMMYRNPELFRWEITNGSLRWDWLSLSERLPRTLMIYLGSNDSANDLEKHLTVCQSCSLTGVTDVRIHGKTTTSTICSSQFKGESESPTASKASLLTGLTAFTSGVSEAAIPSWSRVSARSEEGITAARNYWLINSLGQLHE